MERGAERQRRGDSEAGEEKGSAERQWGEAEVLALLSVWDEVGATDVAESRSTFEVISERLRRLSVMRSWRECQAKCRSMRLQSRKLKASTSTNYSPGEEERPVERPWEEDDVGNQRRIYPSSVTAPIQEGKKTRFHVAVNYTTNAAEEGGRHWTDDEVRALLCVWADRSVRERLKCTLRNKSIFQEMARQMQRNFGVIRNWKQCRTKYKNLKYDYKTAKSAHAAGGSGAGGPGKYMKFFDEVEAILLDQGLENGTMEMQKRLYEGEMGTGRLQKPTGHTGQMNASETEVVIEIDDDENSDDYDTDGDTEVKWRSTDVHLPHTDSASSDQFHVVTVSDTGRNWSDQEVRALIQVWSDERIRKQLESSTRKRDIFVQISNRLMQQGIERDWKQCHTKYKNLKYVYRSLQRGKTDEADPRRLMRFYDEVDAIMNHVNNDLLHDTEAAESVDSGRLAILNNGDHKNHVDGNLTNTTTAVVGPMEDRTCNSDSDSSVNLDAASNTDESKLHALKEHHLAQGLIRDSETGAEKDDTHSANRGRKRRAVDQGPVLHRKVTKLETDPAVAGVQAQCKEEQDHIPIIKINSVCSMASQSPSPDIQVSSCTTEVWCRNLFALLHLSIYK